MRLTRIIRTSVTAVVVTAALAVAGGTANASPAPLVAASQQGVGFATSTQNRTVTTVLDAGTFRITDNGSAVAVLDAKGRQIASVPLTFSVADRQFALAPTLSQGATSLSVTPRVDASVQRYAGTIAFPRHDVSSQSRFISELNRAAPGAGIGAAIGAGIGLAVGCVIGIIVGCIPGILIGAGAGALIGLINAGGPRLQNAAIAFFSGRP